MKKKFILFLATIVVSVSWVYADTQSDEKIDRDLGVLSETWNVAPPAPPQCPPDPHTLLGQPFFQQPDCSDQPAGASYSPSHG